MDKVDNTLINILQHSMDSMKASSTNLKALVNLLDHVSEVDTEVRSAPLLDSGGPSSQTHGKKNSPLIKKNLDELKSVISSMDNI